MTWTENRARIFSAEAQNCLVLLSCTWIGFCSTRRLRKSEENRPPAKTKAASCSPSKTRTRYVPRHSLYDVSVKRYSSNVHQRPQWCVTPLGQLILPMRMRPARPIGLPLEVLKAQNQNLTFKSQEGKEGRKRRRTATSTPPTRARRVTIDPLRWGSTHISGVFLKGEWALMSPALDVGGKTSGKTGVSSEVEGDEEV